MSTVRRRLHEVGLKSRQPALKPFLEDRHKDARRTWGRDKLQWPRNRWDGCFFADESRFYLHPAHRSPRVWRRTVENRLDERFIRRRELYGGGSVMVWAGISRNFKSQLVIVDGNLTARRYRDEILTPHVRPLRQAAQPGAFMLCDDNALPHRANLVRDYLCTEGIERMDWPAKSPDLNPIENLWGIMKRRVSDRQQPHHTLRDLRGLLVQEWANIEIETVNAVLNSMPHRARAVVQRNGLHIDY